MKKLIIYILFLFIGINAIAQQISTLKTFDFNESTSPWCIAQGCDNDFIIGGIFYTSYGYTSDAFLMKIDSDGDSLWSIHYQGEYESLIRSVIVLNDSTFVGVGTTNSWMSENGILYGDVLLLSVNSRGEILWSKQFTTTRNDEGYRIVKSKFGGMIACGMSDNVGPNILGSYWILRLNDLGDTIWTKSIYMGPSSYALEIYEDSDENIYAFGSGAHIIKLDKNGILTDSITCEKQYMIRHLIESEDSFFITGIDEKGYFVGKFDLTGKNYWNKYFGGSFFDLLLSNDSTLLMLVKEDSLSVSVSKIKTDGTTVWKKKIDMENDFNYITGTHYKDNKFFLIGYVDEGYFHSKMVTMILEDKTNGVALLDKQSLITVKNSDYQSINVLSSSSQRGNLEFFDLAGKKIKSVFIEESSTQISYLFSGLYIYRFVTEKGEVQSGKVVVW
jgi:hypothetical protein